MNMSSAIRCLAWPDRFSKWRLMVRRKPWPTREARSHATRSSNSVRSSGVQHLGGSFRSRLALLMSTASRVLVE